MPTTIYSFCPQNLLSSIIWSYPNHFMASYWITNFMNIIKDICFTTIKYQNGAFFCGSKKAIRLKKIAILFLVELQIIYYYNLFPWARYIPGTNLFLDRVPHWIDCFFFLCFSDPTCPPWGSRGSVQCTGYLLSKVPRI